MGIQSYDMKPKYSQCLKLVYAILLFFQNSSKFGYCFIFSDLME